MEFLKKMKSREIIEMSLKTVIGVIVGLILAILMEGMIYNIYMDKINENKANQYMPVQCVAYCEEVGDDLYRVYLNDTSSDSWHVKSFNESREQIESAGYGSIEFRKPNAFDVSITGTHYVVISVVIAGILGFYGWRFFKLNKEYKSLEKKYQKTGKIFA